jgi:hypothetical protein
MQFSYAVANAATGCFGTSVHDSVGTIAWMHSTNLKRVSFICVSLKTPIRRTRAKKGCFKYSDITNTETIFNALRLFDFKNIFI